ncbi:MAG: 2Fe-2S iron-sulfur cluster-binding protein [Chloroflexota bacterium]
MATKTSVSLTIDGKQVGATQGETVLWAALGNDIYIPNLCAIRERVQPFAACRLCFVEIEGQDRPTTACTTPVADGMVVHTGGEAARRLSRTALELLLASHPVDCANCPRNGACELQKIAAHLRVNLRRPRFRDIPTELRVDASHPLFTYDPNKCVLCGRCVWTCREEVGLGVIGFAYRGFKRVMTTFGDRRMAESCPADCHRCVDVCPVGALTLKQDI